MIVFIGLKTDYMEIVINNILANFFLSRRQNNAENTIEFIQ